MLFDHIQPRIYSPYPNGEPPIQAAPAAPAKVNRGVLYTVGTVMVAIVLGVTAWNVFHIPSPQEIVGDVAKEGIKAIAGGVVAHNQHVVERDNFRLLQQNKGLQGNIATLQASLDNANEQITFLETRIKELEAQEPTVVYKTDDAHRLQQDHYLAFFEFAIADNGLRRHLR